jgi:hypothetical protein
LNVLITSQIYVGSSMIFQIFYILICVLVETCVTRAHLLV